MQIIILIDDNFLPSPAACWAIPNLFPAPSERTYLQEKINDAQRPCLGPSLGHANQRRS